MYPSLHSRKVQGAVVALLIALSACTPSPDHFAIPVSTHEGACPGFRLTWSVSQGVWGEVRPYVNISDYAAMQVTVNEGYQLQVCTSNTTQYALYNLDQGVHHLTYEVGTTPSWHYSVALLEEAT